MPDAIDYHDATTAFAAEELSHRFATAMAYVSHDDRILLLERTVALILFGPFSKQDLTPEEGHAVMDKLWGAFLSDVETEIAELKLRRSDPPSPEEETQ